MLEEIKSDTHFSNIIPANAKQKRRAGNIGEGVLQM
jgi:hypothetical protein